MNKTEIKWNCENQKSEIEFEILIVAKILLFTSRFFLCFAVSQFFISWDSGTEEMYIINFFLKKKKRQ